MRKIILLWLCALALFALPAFAQLTPALWKIEKQGMTSYLLGTVHVGDKSMEVLPSTIENAIKNSDSVVVEVNLEALSALQIQQRSLPYLRLPQGRTLDSELTTQSYKMLSDYFGDKNINITLFSSLKPWAVLLTMMQLEIQNAGFVEHYGIDKQVVLAAQKLNKPVLELETLEQQMEIFTALEGHADQMVADTFRQLKELDGYFEHMVEAWKTGDTEVLINIYDESFDDSPFGKLNEQVLLIERNKRWIESLAQPLSEESLFIAVGALHLFKDNGLIALLEQQGFVVTRL
ncbi:TraB/GumN family protein [Pseudoalteromonas sp. SSDWG2]|uniref:TraB/GumN family protein n=1 Tax=Pseudoalteromonas sp. SSDWG2 TaxID=3139391 RepID=UPI003BAA1E8A